MNPEQIAAETRWDNQTVSDWTVSDLDQGEVRRTLEEGIRRNRGAAVATLPETVKEGLSSSELAGWEWLSRQQKMTSGEYAAAMTIPARTAQNHLKRFMELGLVSRHGSARSTRYEVKRS